MKTLLLALAIPTLLAICFGRSSARTWYIVPNGSGDAPTIQAGIDSAAAGDTLLLANGTYTGVGNREMNYQGKAITVRSEGGSPALCVIDCESMGYGFLFNSGEGAASLLEGITVTNGGAYSGGAIGFGSSPTITNCTFSGNSAVYGGAMVCGGPASPKLINCTFSDNSANGDGAVTLNGGSPTFVNCVFSNNSAFEGAGAVWCRFASPTFENCIFIGNSTSEAGGGIQFFEGSSGTLTNCVFAGNSAPYGGGISAFDLIPVITNCTFYGNSADISGGGIWFGGPNPAEPKIRNSIFAFNNGEAFYYSSFCDSNFAIVFSCCDLYGNTGGDWVGCIAGGDSINGNLSQNPLFCDPENGDLTLSALSPCLPANNTCGVLIGAHGEGCSVPTGIEADIGKLQLALRPPYPNPFNPETSIVYQLPEGGIVSVKVYDVRGRLVKTLVDTRLSAGEHRTTWNGQDNDGRQVATGIYLIKFWSGGQTRSTRVLLLK
ncbi:MAG: T9SS type A sorting domain-containing protein [Gammaproteobacteria bacterium]|nr:T9SS type A sorting domain-containing protein [Gammaproteobacteria bacterium]